MTLFDLKLTVDDMIKEQGVNAPVCYQIWQKDDVDTKANEMGLELTEEETAQVLHSAHDNQDAGMGISWTTLACEIDWIVESRDK